MTVRIINIKEETPDRTRAVDIMRSGGLFGNPFVIGVHGSRDDVVDLHMEYARRRIGFDAAFRKQVKRLKGYDLLCCCAPQRCHGDNLKILCEELNA